MRRTFIETRHFTSKWKELNFSDDELRALQFQLLDNPKIGAVMRGTGGLRKMRFAFENRGKSGSCRICYLDIERKEQLHLIDIFAKNEKENLSNAERNNIKQLVEFIKQYS